MAAPGDVAYFAAMLERLYQRLPYSVTSWWRTIARNVKVGGESDSRHLDGLGIDAEPDPPHTTKELLDEARRLGLHGLDEGDHAHIQLYAKGQDRA